MRIATYINCLWEGTTQIRLDDLPKLVDTGFNCFLTHLTPAALDPTTLDGKFLELCKTAKVQVVVEKNTLSNAQYQQLVVKYPGTVIGLIVSDDANNVKPVDLAKMVADVQPFLNGTTPYISVGKSTDHAVYAPLIGSGGYTVQNYIGPKVLEAGLRPVCYDAMVTAKAASQGSLFSIAYLGRNSTPYFARNDPVMQAWEYVDPGFNEAHGWLGIFAGCTGPMYYTAYEISNVVPQLYSRIGERSDLLPAYKLIFARMQKVDAVMQTPGVIKTVIPAAATITGQWTKPDGSGTRVVVDMEEQRYPQVRIEPFPGPTQTSVRITSAGPVKVETLP